MTFPRITLVLGGANSGKSLFAERLIRKTGSELVYLATGQAFDDEMAAKIAEHRARRGLEWETIEAPLALAEELLHAPSGSAVLIDCLSFWLSNHLLKDSDLEAEMEEFLATLRGVRRPVVLVSNEVGMGVVPDHPLGRRFRSVQGALNQRVAEQADLVVAVMAGLPLVLKGQLPS